MSGSPTAGDAEPFWRVGLFDHRDLSCENCTCTELRWARNSDRERNPTWQPCLPRPRPHRSALLRQRLPQIARPRQRRPQIARPRQRPVQVERPRPLRPASVRVPRVLESAVMHRQSLPHPSSGQLPARRHARRRHWKHTPSFSQRANAILWPCCSVKRRRVYQIWCRFDMAGCWYRRSPSIGALHWSWPPISRKRRPQVCEPNCAGCTPLQLRRVCIA